jgi:hypothetical protein
MHAGNKVHPAAIVTAVKRCILNLATLSLTELLVMSVIVCTLVAHAHFVLVCRFGFQIVACPILKGMDLDGCRDPDLVAVDRVPHCVALLLEAGPPAAAAASS